MGESWQCPLAEGGTCASVAAADPAVSGPDAAPTAAPAEPLWRVRGGAGAVAPEADAGCGADCAGFDLFAWLARLFGLASAAGEESAGTAEATASGSVRLAPPDAPPPSGEAISPPAKTSPLPAGAGPAGDAAAGGSLRTGEVVARIWIAPFVDAHGVYREGAYVRAVLAPARWRVK